MNVNLQYSMKFAAGIYHDDQLKLNSYDLNLDLITADADPAYINVALDRIKAFIYHEMDHVIFVSEENEIQTLLLQSIGANVCTLPEEPVDQIIGMMLYCKLNAITEGKLIIDELNIASVLGDDVWFQHNDEDPLGVFSQDGWWHKSNCQKIKLDRQNQDQNVVKVESWGWREYGLEWPTKSADHKAKIVYPNFNKNENK